MKKEEFFFDSRDGRSKIHGVRYEPDSGDVTAVLQLVHGMAEYVERYEEFAEYMTERGFVVTGDDHLGHGKTVTEGGKYGYFCEQDAATVVVRDVHRLKKKTQALYPGKPYIILGHSMGSFILRNYLCRYGTGIEGAVIMGTGMPSAGLIQCSKAIAALQKAVFGSEHVSNLLNAAAFGGYNRRIPDAKTTADWLSRDTGNVDRYLADSLCGFTFTVNGFQTLFELISRLHDPDNVAKVPKELPILMVSGKDDPVGDYGEGVQRAYDSLKAAGVENLTMKLYEEDRHEILNETDKIVVMQDIYHWIRDVVLTQNSN